MNSNPIRKQIVDKADIVNIISQYVKLEKKGNNYIGLCPFHDDKNPSMSVSPQKKVFKCFSCGTGGDVVKFISKFKNISISDALREVGATVGINVALSQKDIERQKNQKYYDVLKEANQFFHFFLQNTVDGKKGLDYLQSRKISLKEVERFEIGLAGDNDILYKTLNEKKYLPLDMIEVGLIRGGDFYHDTFKNRILFPIKDLDGNVVGFSGRRFLPESEKESKYLNTSETIVFKKGEILYNYSDAIQDIKASDNVYLFEGFMDVIAACRANVLNSVASMGTALTVNQIHALKRLTKNVTVCYDSDGPGTIATIKAIGLLLQAGMNVNIARIPEGKDPDEYIFNHGELALHTELTTNTMSAMEFLYNNDKQNVDYNNINSVEKFKKNVFKNLSMFNSNILVEKTLNTLASDLGVSVENLVADYNQNKKDIIVSEHDSKQIAHDINKTTTESNKRFENSQSKYLISERRLILASYNNKKSCLEIESRLENCFYSEVNRNILSNLRLFYQKYEMMNDEILFAEFLSQDEQETLKDILKNETMPTDVEIKDFIKNIKSWPFEKVINILNNKKDKTIEDIQRLSEYKKKITIINKKSKE